VRDKGQALRMRTPELLRLSLLSAQAVVRGGRRQGWTKFQLDADFPRSDRAAH
jgi:hypothetical protein